MDQYNDNPLDAVTGGGNVAPAVGSENVVDDGTQPASSATGDGLSLDEINKLTGRNYKDVDTARNALKETYSYVGTLNKRLQEVSANSTSQPGNSAIEAEVKALKEEMFYARNPHYEPYRALIARMGVEPASAVATPEFKEVYEKAKGFDDVQKSRTVLSSNPRLGSVSNKLDEARQARAAGDVTKAGDLATQAVREAYNF